MDDDGCGGKYRKDSLDLDEDEAADKYNLKQAKKSKQLGNRILDSLKSPTKGGPQQRTSIGTLLKVFVPTEPERDTSDDDDIKMM